MPRIWSVLLPLIHLAKANWKIALVVAITIPFLLKLGFWQLDRAAEKRAIQSQHHKQMAAPPISVTQLIGSLDADEGYDQLAFRRVEMSGRFLPEYQALLDNRIEQGQAGYHVYTAFLAEGDHLVWVNRGWVRGANDRSLPAVPTPVDTVDILATVYIPPGEQFLLAEDDWGSAWPLRIQVADVVRLNALVNVAQGVDFLPFEVRLEQAMPGGFYVDWAVVSTNPAKHTGYAVQWFAMAIGLLAFWIYQLWSTARNS